MVTGLSRQFRGNCNNGIRHAAFVRPYPLEETSPLDGYRVQVHLTNEAVRVFTRRGNDWTSRFRKIADDAWHIKAGSAIIDGEVVVPATNGATDFSVLQKELKGTSTKIVLIAALPERQGHSKTAALRAQGRTDEDHRRHRRPIQ